MSSKRPDIEQLEGYLKAMPASLQGPDTLRLEAILEQVKRTAPPKRTSARRSRTLWWVILALSTGMATAAIWHQTRRITANTVAEMPRSAVSLPQQESVNAAGHSQRDNHESPISRPDNRFIYD